MIKLLTPLTQLDSEPSYHPGSRTVTKDGNEYIYLPGIDSVVAYDWVVYNTSGGSAYGVLSCGSVTRLTTTTIGPVGIAQAAITNNKYGWFGIKGVFWGNAGQALASGSVLWASGTTANVTTVITTNSFISGAITVGTGVAAGTVKVFINYPCMVGTVI